MKGFRWPRRANPMKKRKRSPEMNRKSKSAMQEISVEITLLSARDLENNGFKTEAYATAWINNDSMNKQQTSVDRVNGINPTWNHCMRFTLDEATLQQGSLLLEVAIFTKTDIQIGDKEIGCVNIPLKHFVQPGCAKSVTYPVQTPSQNSTAIINIIVKTHKQPKLKLHSYTSDGYPSYHSTPDGYPSPPYHNQPQQQPHGYPPPLYHNQTQQQPHRYPSHGYPSYHSALDGYPSTPYHNQPQQQPHGYPFPPYHNQPQQQPHRYLPQGYPPPPTHGYPRPSYQNQQQQQPYGNLSQGYPPHFPPPPPPYQGYTDPYQSAVPRPFQGIVQTSLDAFVREAAAFASQAAIQDILGNGSTDFGDGS